MIRFSLCESLCHRGSGGHAAWPLTPQGQGSRFLPTPPRKGHGLHIGRSLTHVLRIGRKGHKVTVTCLSNYTKNTAQKALGNLCTCDMEK